MLYTFSTLSLSPFLLPYLSFSSPFSPSYTPITLSQSGVFLPLSSFLLLSFILSIYLFFSISPLRSHSISHVYFLSRVKTDKRYQLSVDYSSRGVLEYPYNINMSY
uniref:Uncharacterized protein n=1 Tax=Cacopsylla melanoneura TaxID=428564 RepID=A0A8D8LF58_9HEMI